MFVAPGPIDVVHASVRMRKLAFRKRRSGMHHRLFIAAKVIAQPTILLQRLPDTGDIAMPKNSETSRNEAKFFSIARGILVLQKSDDRLRHRKTPCSCG